MRRGRARDLPPAFATCHRQSAIDDEAVLPGRELEREAAGVRFLAYRHRRRAAGIHQDQRARALQALVTGMGRVRERRAAGVVVGENGGDEIGRSRTHAIEEREVAVAVPEEAQHRHHAIDGIEQRWRRHEIAGGERGPQRQEVNQQLDERTGIAADMAAVGQDLTRQLI